MMRVLIASLLLLADSGSPTVSPGTPTPPAVVAQKPEVLAALDDAKQEAAAGQLKAAMVRLFRARFKDPEAEPLTYWLWKYASVLPPPQGDAGKFAGEYLSGNNGRFVLLPEHAKEIKTWMITHPPPPATP